MVPVHPDSVKAVLTLLGQEEEGAVYNVSVVKAVADEMQIAGAPTLAIGSPVKIFQDPHLWLGEVREYLPGNILVIALVHSLKDVHQLSRLADSFLGIRRDPVRELS